MNYDHDWILRSPSLMTVPEGIVSFTELYKQFSSVDDFYPVKTEKFPAGKLGIYYEDLVEGLINMSSKPIVFKRNLQVKKDRVTLGEFDFIGQVQETPFHLECAIKFYLRVGPGDQLSDFIGPGKKDRLDIKWHRLLRHQLPLSSTPEGKAVCEEQGVADPAQVLLLQGYLFHPFAEGVPENLAGEINPAHLHGWWLRHSEVECLGDRLQFARMEKPCWLHPNVCEAINLEKLKRLLKDLNYPILVTRGRFRNDQWEELDRGFVVPDTW